MQYLKFWPYPVIAALLIGLLWFRGDAIKQDARADKVQVELTTAQAVNAANQAAFVRLDRQARANEAILLDVQGKVSALNNQAAATNAELAQLRRDNAEIRAYLDSPIPADVRRLLERPNAR